jgi:hypothetical protein
MRISRVDMQLHTTVLATSLLQIPLIIILTLFGFLIPQYGMLDFVSSERSCHVLCVSL